MDQDDKDNDAPPWERRWNCTKALDAIARICGCSEWEYPEQVVRDVQKLSDSAFWRRQYAHQGQELARERERVTRFLFLTEDEIMSACAQWPDAHEKVTRLIENAKREMWPSIKPNACEPQGSNK